LTLCIYPLRSDNTVRFGMIILRVPSRIRERYSGQLSYFALLDEKMKRQAVRIARMAGNMSIPAYPEKAGHQEYRVWFFFDRFEHFLRVKRFLKDFLTHVTHHENDFILEAAMPTRSMGIGWKEHPVLLPLGVDRASVERSLFLNSDGTPCENQLKHLERIRPFSLRWGLGRLRSISEKSPRGVSDRGFQGIVEKLKSLCPVVDYLIRKSLSGHMLKNQEKVVLFYTVGLVDENGYTLHRLLEATPDYNYAKVKNQLSRLKKNPISCIKIRNLLPELTASLDCSCSFKLHGGKYPSPLLHVIPEMVPVVEDFRIPERIGLRETAERYVRLHRYIAEQRAVLSKLEQKLEELFSKKGLSQYCTKKFCIRRHQDDDRTEWMVEFK